jgi:hypothetical protein
MATSMLFRNNRYEVRGVARRQRRHRALVRFRRDYEAIEYASGLAATAGGFWSSIEVVDLNTGAAVRSVELTSLFRPAWSAIGSSAAGEGGSQQLVRSST